ncbi:hypothetical protein J6590_058187 [Homalodisca vitripennis]|nr:hypothetical protein J6590_058183 [Homalodisca vitripennis]KAG8301192.1 hypothetical protein J6590_058187 [Homalodisca vitripennis]
MPLQSGRGYKAFRIEAVEKKFLSALRSSLGQTDNFYFHQLLSSLFLLSEGRGCLRLLPDNVCILGGPRDYCLRATSLNIKFRRALNQAKKWRIRGRNEARLWWTTPRSNILAAIVMAGSE